MYMRLLKLFFLTFLFLGVNNIFADRLETNKVIVLDTDNHFSLRTMIDDTSVDNLLYNVYTSDLSDVNDVFLYLLSPGGYVTSGHRIIRLIESLEEQGKDVHCIADFAGSMAFAIFQSCTHRYVMPGSILFHHQVSTSVQGTLKYIEKNIEFVKDMTYKMDKLAADNMGVSLEEFRDYFVEDREVYGDTAIELGLADTSIHVQCSPELTLLSESVIVDTWFGQYEVIYSRCPLLHAPQSFSPLMEKTDECGEDGNYEDYLKNYFRVKY